MIFNGHIKKIMLSLLVELCVVISYLGTPLLVTAQSPEDLDIYGASLNETDIDIIINPENPRAFQDVRLYITSNLIDLNKQKISWFLNGKLEKSAFGAREFITTAGENGSSQNIQVIIETDDRLLRKTVLLQPSDIVVLWEAIDSYVPPFYQGKKLPSREATLRISANPYLLSGKSIAQPEDAVYVWSRNGNPISESSGFGKNSFTFKHNRIRENEIISVEVSGLKNSVTGSSSIITPLVKPFVLLYEKNPVTHIKHGIIRSSFLMNEPEKILVAEPYFFSTLDNNPANLRTTWTMNNISLENPFSQLLIRNPGKYGSSKIGVSFANTVQTLQTADANTTILFSE